MNQTIVIAPVRKSVRVSTTPEHAFEVFTQGISHWWPTQNTVGKAPMAKAVLEPRLGGRWYELSQDGSEAQVGVVLVWEPPARFVVGWRLNSRWQPDVEMESIVEITFTEAEPGVVLVELEHRDFEALGAEGGASLRKDVDGGWPGMLARFAAAAEGRPYEPAQ
jgi:uncharacterized protein YndB with AHSA1/START domain